VSYRIGNVIESVNHKLRKVTPHRGHFPDDDAVLEPLTGSPPML
jgi:transposase-like protein